MASIPIVKVYVLPTGYLWLPDEWIFDGGDPDVTHLSPDFSFLVCHPSGKNILFDLGLRKDLENFPPKVRDDFDTLAPYVPLDARDLLLSGPIHPDSISQIVLSHLHFDHAGDVTRFPEAKILMGAGSLEAASPGYPKSKDSTFDSNIFIHPGGASEFPVELYRNDFSSTSLPTSSGSFPFDSAVDLFGDASFLLLPAPGHMAGHQVGLARTAEDEWVAMGGDCCHHRGFLEGSDRKVGTAGGPAGQPGFHKDPVEAQRTIERFRALHGNPDVLAVLAHDASLEGELRVYPEILNGWRKEGVKGRKRETVLTLEEVKGKYPVPSKKG